MSACSVPSFVQTWDRLRRPVWLYDPHTARGVYANVPALALWGAETLDELLARDFSVLSPAVKVRTDRLVALTADGGEVSERWTFYPNGQPVTVQASISAFSMDDGREVLLFEAAPTEVDAGERRAVEALRHTSAVITLFDRDGGRLFANPAAYGAYGSDDVEFAARFADPAEGEAMFAAAVAGESVAGVCAVVTAEGRRWHHMDARPVIDPVTGSLGVLLNEQNVTARVEAETARSAAEQKAAMSEARQRFLTDMSHELRTPLNAVIGFSGLLVDAGLEASRTGQARLIHEAGQDLLTVVNRMIAEPDADAGAGQAGMPEGAMQEPAEETGMETESEMVTASVRVLYVDDNQSNRTLVKAMLATQEIVCETADDGAQGVDAAAAGDWDVILMDIQMPVMDGVAAARGIRALDGQVSATPIIALTANTLDEQVRGYFEAGMDDLIAKPVDMIELLTKVAQWGGSGWRETVGTEAGTGAD
ncbi:response regulator [uncultured Brevundimonas sp.]|uniref:response regulator n=1 Tax=uncultured Brevundimonas sp. TaxID=213418 RepID=UPI0030EF20FC|tara:strand:+ start:2256 stop:3692 length:1437 start_codon:yes stop_codon:yes gene_type:complete